MNEPLPRLVILTAVAVDDPPITPRVKVDIVSVQLKLEQAKYQQTCCRAVACNDRLVAGPPVVV